MIRRIAMLAALGAVLAPSQDGLAQTSYGGEDDWFAWVRQGNFKPFLGATYGYAMPKHSDLGAELANVGSAELVLGFSEIEPYDKKYVVSIDERYAFGSYAASDLDPFDEVGSSELDTRLYGFGIGNRLGYGYRIGAIELLPYNQNAMAVTQVEWKDRPTDLSAEDAALLDRFEGDYRFSTLAEPGAKVRLFKGLSVFASYEMRVVFPRYVFGKWVGSAIVQYAGQSALTYFADEIVNTSPIIGPLLYFVLKNGLSYAFYAAMKTDAYWPFSSETPLRMEAAKLGVSLTF